MFYNVLMNTNLSSYLVLILGCVVGHKSGFSGVVIQFCRNHRSVMLVV